MGQEEIQERGEKLRIAGAFTQIRHIQPRLIKELYQGLALGRSPGKCL